MDTAVGIQGIRKQTWITKGSCSFLDIHEHTKLVMHTALDTTLSTAKKIKARSIENEDPDLNVCAPTIKFLS